MLLPIAVIGALFLVWQGVTQTWAGPQDGHDHRGCAADHRAWAPSPPRRSIKELGTNGGGFFNANSAHPFENPNGLTNWLQHGLDPGHPVRPDVHLRALRRDQRQGWTIFGAMFAILFVGAAVAMAYEGGGNALFPAGIDQALGNMEGKETRFGAAGRRALCAAITTGHQHGRRQCRSTPASRRSAVSSRSSTCCWARSPPAASAPASTGCSCSRILAVFIAGLMVGRTPEYLGKKIESFEMKMAMVVVLVLAASVLGFTALGTIVEPGEAGRARQRRARTASPRSCTRSPARPATTAPRSAA